MIKEESAMMDTEVKKLEDEIKESFFVDEIKMVKQGDAHVNAEKHPKHGGLRTKDAMD